MLESCVCVMRNYTELKMDETVKKIISNNNNDLNALCLDKDVTVETVDKFIDEAESLIDVHNNNEKPFRLACYNCNLELMKYFYTKHNVNIYVLFFQPIRLVLNSNSPSSLRLEIMEWFVSIDKSFIPIFEKCPEKSTLELVQCNYVEPNPWNGYNLNDSLPPMSRIVDVPLILMHNR